MNDKKYHKTYSIILLVFLLNIVAFLCGYGCFFSKKILSIPKEKKSAQITNQQTKEEKVKQPNDSLKKENKELEKLSPASLLMIRSCDNYLAINPQSQKAAEVNIIKATVYYNNKMFEEARKVYQTIIDSFPGDPHKIEAIRMMAQSYYEENRFEESQEWYRKLKDFAVDKTDRLEAITRIAESIFKMGEAYEANQKYKEAASQYERVALEFPDAKIAEASLFNAGNVYEKLGEWQHAILMYQKLAKNYSSSKLLAKAQFRTAKCFEKLMQWNNAGEMYLRVAANFPTSDLASVSLYNAGFCFENANKLEVAAATFEKMAQLYPNSDDVADVLFKAGELYGKLKDWVSVTRVNQEFTKRFGNDADRVIQALCMVGIALYMQNKNEEAIEQLKKAVTTYSKIKNPSDANKYYAAKAEFTIGEINHEAMNKIALTLPKENYKKQLKIKTDILDDVIATYSRVVRYQISEWTTRSIFSIGKAYEDYAISIFKQERPQSASLEERIALELGIAQAVEEYFVNKAAHYYEENVKLGIKEKIENKYILDSRTKLTYLPYVAGQNYLALINISQGVQTGPKAEGFGLVAKKLEMLQKIAPFQERAINLFLKSLENGSKYQIIDEFYNKASELIIKTAYTVGVTYADISLTAREAPIPTTFDPYESFVYKTKLLKQIETYEEKSMENYLKAIKIAEAYKIDDEYVKKNKEKLAELLFLRGRCYDILGIVAFVDPPFPKKLNDAEKEEFRARFEEVSMTFQQNAIDAYKTILQYANQNYATGEYVTHAYIRLYQKFPKEYGIKQEKLESRTLSTGPQWKCTNDTVTGWKNIDFDDEKWFVSHKVNLKSQVKIPEIPSPVPSPLWFGNGDPKSPTYSPSPAICTRYTFYNYDPVKEANLILLGNGQIIVAFNEKILTSEDTISWNKSKKWDVTGIIRNGKNVIAIYIINNNKNDYGIIPIVNYSVITNEYLPMPPNASSALDPKQVAEGVYLFPKIINFETPVPSSKKSNL